MGEVACGSALIGFNTRCRGPAPHWSGEKDLIGEMLVFFKANMLMKKFDIKGPCDRTLLYLTFYAHQCLIRFVKKKCRTAKEGEKCLFTLINERITCPGDRGFILSGFFPEGNTQERRKWESYMKQAREEVGERVKKLVFGDGKPNVFWLQFAKRKFLNKALEQI